MSKPLRIWCNAAFPADAMEILRAGTAQHELIRAETLASSVLRSSPTDPNFASAEVAFGQPDPGAMLGAGPQLRWVQLTTAAYTRYDRADLRAAWQARGAALTTSSPVFNEPCAQHLLAMMLALARQLPQSLLGQMGDRAWPYPERRKASRLLGGESALLYGFGAIAERLVELLAPFGMKLTGVRREPRGNETIPMIRESEADGLLPGTDHVINILPESPATLGYFDEARFARMKSGARFYNIGRGPTVDQDALGAALQSGVLDAAYLDVTNPEPLPPDHSLWSAPHCFICPHTGGGHSQEFVRLVRHFLTNLEAFEGGHELLGRAF